MRTVVVGRRAGWGAAWGSGWRSAARTWRWLARRRDRLEVAAKGGRPETSRFACDVTDEASCRSAIDEAAAGLGGIDALVYTPAIGPLSRLVDTDTETWRRVFDHERHGAARATAFAIRTSKPPGASRCTCPR